MKINLTESAITKIHDKTEDSSLYIKLKYETEGCGCVMSGVPILWAVEEVEEDDEKIITNDVPIYVEKTKKVFLDDEMTIDFQSQTNTFMLKCPSQILNPRMSFIIK